MSDSLPLISVIVPTYNEAKTIEKCINALLKQNYPKNKLEIIVVNDGSTDETEKILKKYSEKIKIISINNGGPSRARNIGAKNAKGELIASTDGDCIVDPNWVKELVRCFDNKQVYAAGGAQFAPLDQSQFGNQIQKFLEASGFLGEYVKSKKNGIIETDHNPSCNSMYRKNVFSELGGFEEGLWPSEDVDLDYRLKKLGYIIKYNPNAIVYHYRPKDMSAFRRMMYSYGKTAAILAKRYGFFRKIYFEPIFIVLSILLIMFLTYIHYSFLIMSALLALITIFYFNIIKKVNLTILFLALYEWNRAFILEYLQKI